MNGYFPFLIDIKGKDCLVAGEGAVGERKARILRRFGAHVETTGAFRPEMTEKMFLVVAATNDAKINHEIAAICRNRGILVNVVDDAAASSFIFPAIAVKEPFTVAVSTGGSCPAAAALLRKELEEKICDDACEKIKELAGNLATVREKFPDIDKRRVWLSNQIGKIML